MLNDKQFRFECENCGRCCIDKETIVNITFFDIKRIYSKLKLTIDELIHILGFYIFDKPLSQDTLLKMVISPIITEKGFAFLGLRKLENNYCFFFDKEEKKCRIYEIRPDICRIFPFSFEYKDKDVINIIYSKKAKQYCIGINNDAPTINKNKLKALALEFSKILKKNEEIISDWNNILSKKKRKLSIRDFIEYILKLEF
ncbi:MAG: YkgJ family cysteine cluster protein [Candidatus Lokiarchaeota archaeon]|nr:YkgJ family cysteine cluster protein [Candidatus Lokiarchaeota archaeon]